MVEKTTSAKITGARIPDAKLGVFGAGGRMGREIIGMIAATPGATLAGAVEAAGHACVGAHLSGGLVVCSNARALAHTCDVLVDFTTPAALETNLDAARAARRPMLIGTTGLGPAHMKAIDSAAHEIAVLQSANVSLGVTLLAALVEQAAARLPTWHAEILELHHAGKTDAPSGTALLLGQAVARGRGHALPAPRAARGGVRPDAEIGFASLRGGTSAGEHSVLLLGQGERIELTHRAESRAILAAGAIAAAMWLKGRSPGRYTMKDVLSL